MNDLLNNLWRKKHLLISGPCSAETEEQVIQTAVGLAAGGKTDVLRAGVWKPRTKPGMFEGIGAPALKWLQEAKRQTGLPLTVEVATGAHVNAALEHEIDILWIGARTTVNPFSVQEIADALRGTDIPVYIKNPIIADNELWSGAIERLQKSGIEHIGMIHRGFSSYGNTEYRNAPMWHLPIEMKTRFPGMPILCDPSHICGNRVMLQYVAQKSIDLDFDGLMLETHIDPDNAWSDAKQQITPQQLTQLISGLTWRTSAVTAAPDGLADLRGEIDNLDDELLSLLGRRMKIADKIGKYKKDNNLTILQAARWKEILQRAVAKGGKLALSEKFLVKYFNAVHLESISHQSKVMNDESENPSPR